jgi:hypothetical protein
LRNFASRGNYTEMSEKRPPFSFWRGLQHAWSNCLGVANNFSASAGALVLTIVSVVTGWKMPTPDGALGLLLGWVLSAAAIWIIIFVGRLIYSPVYFLTEPHGGIWELARARLGMHLWPILLMISSVFAFAILFTSGAVWFLLQSSAQGQLGPSISQPVTQPNLALDAPTDTYVLRWDSASSLRLMFRKEGDFGDNFQFPAFVLRKTNLVSVAGLTIKWRANISGFEKIIESSRVFSKYKLTFANDSVLIQDPQLKLPPWGYPFSTEQSYQIPFVNKDTSIFMPLKLYDLATLYLFAMLPSENGAKTDPLTFSVFIDWNIPDGGKPEEFKVTATATNTRPNSADKAAISAVVDFRVEKVN